MSEVETILRALFGDAYVPLGIAVLVVLNNIAAKLIPDSATGFWGAVRKIADILGLNVRNRVQPGVTTDQVVQDLLKESEDAR